MNKVAAVKPLPNYELLLTFSNHEVRRFDVKPYLDKGIFVELKDEDYFRKVALCMDSIAWKSGQDFSPETLYLRSEFVGNDGGLGFNV